MRVWSHLALIPQRGQRRVRRRRRAELDRARARLVELPLARVRAHARRVQRDLDKGGAEHHWSHGVRSVPPLDL